jgi:hypothetical protein
MKQEPEKILEENIRVIQNVDISYRSMKWSKPAIFVYYWFEF